MFAMNRVIMTLCGMLCYVYAAAAVSFMYDGKKMTTSPSCLYVNDKKKTALLACGGGTEVCGEKWREGWCHVYICGAISVLDG